MSVLVKGMKMPKQCFECDLQNPFVEEPYCRRLLKICPTRGRLENCPLGEVPTPHGKLKDADAFDSRVREAGGMVDEELTAGFKEGVQATLWILKQVPTVIEAEE